MNYRTDSLEQTIANVLQSIRRDYPLQEVLLAAGLVEAVAQQAERDYPELSRLVRNASTLLLAAGNGCLRPTSPSAWSRRYD